MLFKESTAVRDERSQALDGALSVWREAEARIPAERLSPGARANIRVLVRQRADAAAERSPANLFLPLGRLAAAVGVPALILVVSFGWLIGNVEESAVSNGGSISIESRKVGGQAVFEIANGGRIHRVHRSNSPRDLAHAELFATTYGTFTDSLVGDSGVVYYRID